MKSQEITEHLGITVNPMRFAAIFCRSLLDLSSIAFTVDAFVHTVISSLLKKGVIMLNIKI